MCHFGYLPRQLVCTPQYMFAAISVLLAGVELAAMANMFHSKARAMKTRPFKTNARALLTLEHGRCLRVVCEHESQAMPKR